MWLIGGAVVFGVVWLVGQLYHHDAEQYRAKVQWCEVQQHGKLVEKSKTTINVESGSDPSSPPKISLGSENDGYVCLLSNGTAVPI